MITHFNTTAWPDLVFPLAWHDFGIGPGNLYTCCNALVIMLISNSTANGGTGACRAVVWALWCRFTAVFVETYWLRWDLSNPSWLHERVLLLNTKPWIHPLVFLHDLCTRGPRVTNRRLHVPGVHRIAHDKDMWCATEWVCENGTWLDEDLRVVSLCLFGAAPIIIPHAKISNARWSFGHCHCL